jgi:catechol 2,3-dioxygenase-like lactoylglutathione lyase family enzyme
LNKYATNLYAQISWVYTQDLDSTADFYARGLGLECSRDEGDARIFATDRVVEPKGGMISIVTDDVDAWYLRLLDNGLQIDKPPEQIERFGIYSFFVKDPNGYLLEFQQFVADSASE